LKFDQRIDKSSWIALRVMPSSHTNPIDLLVDNAPIRASLESAQWCRKAVDICWTQKSQRIRPREIDEARAAYERARSVYDRIIAQLDV
jgi:GTP1/Obg family GTP-binding protein